MRQEVPLRHTSKVCNLSYSAIRKCPRFAACCCNYAEEARCYKYSTEQLHQMHATDVRQKLQAATLCDQYATPKQTHFSAELELRCTQLADMSYNRSQAGLWCRVCRKATPSSVTCVRDDCVKIIPLSHVSMYLSK